MSWLRESISYQHRSGPCTAMKRSLHRVQLGSAPETPSQTQATMLSDLLQTSTFAMSVVQGIDLAPTLGLNPATTDLQDLQTAIFNNISKNVKVESPGYNLFTVSYTNTNAQIAQQVVASIIKNFAIQTAAFANQEGKDLLANYNTQLQQAEQQQAQAITAEEQYVSANRNLSQTQLQADPEYQQLDAATKQAQATVQNLETAIANVQQTVANDGNGSTLYEIVDAPRVPISYVSRLGSYLLGGGVGLVLALLVDVVYLVLIARRDHSIYSSYDVQSVAALPVLFQLPTFTSKSVSLLTER